MQQFEDLQPKWDIIKFGLISIANVCGCSYNPYRPENLPYRMFCIIGLFGAMIINIFFNSFSMLVMTTPIFESQIESFQEIINNRFELTGDRFALECLQQRNKVNF